MNETSQSGLDEAKAPDALSSSSSLSFIMNKTERTHRVSKRPPCTVPGCENLSVGYGLCIRHGVSDSIRLLIYFVYPVSTSREGLDVV